MKFNTTQRGELLSLAINCSDSHDSDIERTQPIINFFEHHIAANSYLVCTACGKPLTTEKCCEQPVIMRVLLDPVVLEKGPNYVTEGN